MLQLCVWHCSAPSQECSSLNHNDFMHSKKLTLKVTKAFLAHGPGTTQLEYELVTWIIPLTGHD